MDEKLRSRLTQQLLRHRTQADSTMRKAILTSFTYWVGRLRFPMTGSEWLELAVFMEEQVTVARTMVDANRETKED